jgi:hypothetical protein
MMTEEGLPLLIDFEFSSFDRSLHSGLSAMSSHRGFVGTRWYAAPESLEDDKRTPPPQRSPLEKEVGGVEPTHTCTCARIEFLNHFFFDRNWTRGRWAALCWSSTSQRAV